MKVDFIASEVSINAEMVGHFKLKRKCGHSYKEISELLKLNTFENFDLGFSVYSICALPNDTLLCSLTYDGVSIFDKNYNCIKLTKFNQDHISIWSTATDNKDRIYLADVCNHQIILADFELNKIKIVGRWNGNLKFDDPRLSYSKGRVYVAEHLNKRIQILNDELEFIKIHTLDYKPRYIQVGDDVALVSVYSPYRINVYDNEEFQLKFKYEGHNGSISFINSYFYEYCHHTLTFYCYDQSGSLVEEIKGDKFNMHGSYDGSLQVFNNALICSAHGNKRLYIIKTKI